MSGQPVGRRGPHPPACIDPGPEPDVGPTSSPTKLDTEELWGALGAADPLTAFFQGTQRGFNHALSQGPGMPECHSPPPTLLIGPSDSRATSGREGLASQQDLVHTFVPTCVHLSERCPVRAREAELACDQEIM